MKKLLFPLLLALCVKFSPCQINHPPSKQVMIVTCERFLDLFKSGKFDEAFDYLKPYTVIEDYKMDTLAYTAKRQMTALSGSFGKVIGFQQVLQKEIPGTLDRLIYLMKYERAFLAMRFTLYNNGSGWTITRISYDEKTDELFDSRPML
ncbi:hypothetical protein [Puia dinghuensis]|uniref:Uncharacterized protein n=1 Tax=Puia dinghuensis TaxID=1792502 RepID=A0A8J2UJ82_9BACT|nr:hypothetical protein [Puia dinghuensis]GGB25152.1 hypothetical protein GCM10011511_56370 [Puia dinghuensis]